MVNLSISLILAYLVGSIPTSYIFAKFLKKVDIRKEGSGNVGATNVFRVVGKWPAIIVLALDILKGVIAVLLLSDIFFNNKIGITTGLENYRLLLGLSAISGHIWSAFLKFKGGKGVATTAGVLAVLAPKVLVCVAFVWVIVFVIFRIVSIASILAAMSLPVFSVIFYVSIYFAIFSVILCLGAVYKHKANIARLVRGEEKKLF
ncbi:MAG: glycerol-3-phosphate 1-O-acyltransferase PlsY [Candidatus Omnitrophica bacterium]|nr:glycerol-3-phosphate 1-O-acyltransferase PlsY [Candidatus Omnitrophota bacterium]